jgi:hypothetical protein
VSSVGSRFAVTLGFVLHAAMGGVVLVSGLIMPPAAVLALGVVWAGGAALAILWRDRPGLVLAIPFAMLAIWLATRWIGGSVFGWSA